MKSVILKIKNQLQFIRNKKIFKRVYKNANIIYPLRIDGGENISIGKDTTIQSHSWLLTMPLDGKSVSLNIGDGCQLGHRNHITAVREVIIGNKVLTACNVYISDNYHEFTDINVPILDQPVKFKENVSIGDGAWLGENVCVIGASVGRNCVIGANSVVTKDIPDYCVAVGSPARIIRHYSKKEGYWIDGKPE